MENAIAANHSCFYSLDVLKIPLDYGQSRALPSWDKGTSARSEVIEDHDIAERVTTQQVCGQMTSYESSTTCDKYLLHARVANYFVSRRSSNLTSRPDVGTERANELLESVTSQDPSTAIPIPAITNKRVKKRGQ